VKAALDAADVASATGAGAPYIWVPALLACDEPPPTTEEEVRYSIYVHTRARKQLEGLKLLFIIIETLDCL